MKKLIISALCLIGCFAVCVQPVYANNSDNVKTGERIEIDNHGNVELTLLAIESMMTKIPSQSALNTYLDTLCVDWGLLSYDT